MREHYFDRFLNKLGLLCSLFFRFRILGLSASYGSNFGSYLLADLGRSLVIQIPKRASGGTNVNLSGVKDIRKPMEPHGSLARGLRGYART